MLKDFESELKFARRYEGHWDMQLMPIAIEDTIMHYPEAIKYITKKGQPKSKRAAKKLANLYFNVLDHYLKAGLQEDYSQAPASVRNMLLDTAYNAGAPTVISQVKVALRDKNYQKVARQLLNTATIGGRASAGLAKRRAELHNRVIKDQAKQKIAAYSGQLKDVVRSIYFNYALKPNIITTISIGAKGLEYKNAEGHVVHELKKTPVKHSRSEYSVPNSVITSV